MSHHPVDLFRGGPPRQAMVVHCCRCMRKSQVIVSTRLGPMCLGCKANALMAGERLEWVRS